MDNFDDMNDEIDELDVFESNPDPTPEERNRMVQFDLYICAGYLIREYYGHLMYNDFMYDIETLHSAWDDWLHGALLEIRRKLKVILFTISSNSCTFF